MPSRYPTAPVSYDPKQLDQLTRTLINDLTRLEQPFGLGYSIGTYVPSTVLTGGEDGNSLTSRNYAIGEVGNVTVVANGSSGTTYVPVYSGSPADAYNVGQVLAALITDLKLRGLLG
jgi:hypothetical protein